MKKSLKRVLSLFVSVAMLSSGIMLSNMSVLSVTAAGGYILEQGGWFESAYAEWTTVPNAQGFAAYVKEASANDSAYTRLDNELIRKYADHFRADAVGLKAGEYVIKIVPVINGALNEAQAFTTSTLNVKAHQRKGFAFSKNSATGGDASGAYKPDGTLKDNAQVIYVTADNAKTVTAELVTDKNGGKSTFTGLQSIFDGMLSNTKFEQRPLDVRIIGTVSKADLDHISSAEEGLQVKGNKAHTDMKLTIEGIGEDAVIKDFGFLIRNCADTELRNFAIMNFMDDGVSMDTDNSGIWVHNLDLFYGSTGSDEDQAKGDGSLDAKKTDYVTMSYNHLWDAGKTSLCGMGDTEEAHLTYHHNWFDHSDSRHPRIRIHSVHVYNNYFDGVSKFGVGAVKNSNAFVENNYFDEVKYPMLMSKQGSDVYKPSTGTYDDKSEFSNEGGGFIKAYNNIINNIQTSKGGSYMPYDTGSHSVQFDAYEVSSRTQTVPSSVKTLVGSMAYNNFDTNSAYDLGVSASDIDPVADVPRIVMADAGRMNGGDFFESTGTSRSDYPGLTDASSSDVDTKLKSAVESYKSTLVSVGGTSAGGTVEPPKPTTTTKETSTTTTTKAPVVEPSEEATTKSPVSGIKGDADGSGIVDMEDVSHILQYVVGKIKSVASIADVTGDGQVTGSDAYKIARYVNELISSL